MRRILCVHLPYLSTERVRSEGAAAGEGAPVAARMAPARAATAEATTATPALVPAERPLALTRAVGAALVVAEVCPQARAAGLRAGLTLGQAQAIVPELEAREHEPARDRAALVRLADWAVRFSPIVEPVEPDTLLVDITGCELLFGGEERLARQVVAGLARRGFTARVAVADTVGAAQALASSGREELCLVPVGQGSAYLAPLPPERLRIEAVVAERLAALGVRTIGDLLTLPRATLPARFGAGLVRCLQQALGEVFEGVQPHQPVDVPQAGRRFEGPVADTRALVRVAGELLDEIFAVVERRAAGLRRLDCVLYYEGRPPQVVVVALARASRRREHVLQLLAEKLERVEGGMGEEAAFSHVRPTGGRSPKGGGDAGSDTFPQPLPKGEGGEDALPRSLREREGGEGGADRPPSQGGLREGTAFRGRAESDGFSLPKPLPGREGSGGAASAEVVRRSHVELFDPNPGPVGLRLVAREISRWHAGQGELFVPREPGDEEDLGTLIDQVAGRVGYGAVVRPELVDDHQPEMAFRCVCVAEAGLEADQVGPAASSGGSSGQGMGVRPNLGGRDAHPTLPGGRDAHPTLRLPRPVRLLARPVLVRVIALVPDGPPTWFWYGGREYVVAEASGPERIETAWWRGPDVRRDYFRVTTAEGEQYWLFRTMGEGEWYVHGVFA